MNAHSPNITSKPEGPWTVCVAMTGVHHRRGTFDTLAEAEDFQRQLHKQGWYYVPIYRADAQEPFDWAAWDREAARAALLSATKRGANS